MARTTSKRVVREGKSMDVAEHARDTSVTPVLARFGVGEVEAQHGTPLECVR